MRKFLIFVFAIMLGVGAISTGPNAWATSYDPTGAPGNFPLPPATPMVWNQGNVGDALFGEMYRAVLGAFDDPFNFATYISIENVSSNWVAAHVRLRSGRYSIEIWDRIILLSPRDVFWFQFQVTQGTDHLNVQICSSDTKTLRYSGLIGATETSYTSLLDPDIIRQFKTEYPDPNDPVLWEEMTQGYLEVIGLWALPASVNGFSFPTDKVAKDIMGALWNDNQAQWCFYADGNQATALAPNVGFLYGADPISKACALDVQKYLTGHVFMGDFTNGLYFGYPMRAIKDFRYAASGVAYRDCTIRGNRFQCVNGQGKSYNNALILYTGFGTDQAYTEPDWATSFGPTWNDGSDFFADGEFFVDSFSLDDFEDAIVKHYLYADYFNGGFSYSGGEGGTFTLAAIAFPTKYLHYFYNCYSGLFDRINGICAVDIAFPNPYACYGDDTDCWPVGYEDKGSLVRGKLDLGYWIDAVGLSTGIWDLEEKPAGTGSPFKTISLPWEVNFVPIGNLSLSKLSEFCFLSSDSPYTPYAEATYPTWFAGWFLMDSFQLLNDPRWGEGCEYIGYCPEDFPLLGYGGLQKLAVSGQILDWEFTNFSHGRNYEPSWDNPTFNPGASSICDQMPPIDSRYPWYGGFCCE